MKKILLFVCFVLSVCIPVSAIEEVSLDVQSQEEQELTLLEKIQNIKSKEITDTSTPNYLLEDIFTKNFKTGIIENVHFLTEYRGGMDVRIDNADTDVLYSNSLIQAGVKGKFRGSETYYTAKLKFNAPSQFNYLQFLPGSIYVSNKSIPHHTISFGTMKAPVGLETTTPTQVIPFVMRTQTSRNFGNVRKVGLRIKGDYSIIEYNLGGYDSDTYYRSFFPGAEFAGLVNLKPLGKTDGKYGNLKIGGALSAGHNNINYLVASSHAQYEYKNFGAEFEWAKANGFNGYWGVYDNHAEGLNATLSYKITPKIQLVARYDELKPNTNISNNKNREYSAGINWFIKGQGLKLMLNYIFCQRDNAQDSHRVVLGTQILL